MDPGDLIDESSRRHLSYRGEIIACRPDYAKQIASVCSVNILIGPLKVQRRPIKKSEG